MKHYFATDGNYGGADQMVVANTTKWTEKDWQKIEEASDHERVRVAKRIQKKYAK